MTVTVGEMLTRARANVRTEADKMLLDAIEPIYEQHMLIEQLRAPEAHGVTIFCDNPDFNGRPNNAIEYYGLDKNGISFCERYEGETVIEALRAALAARPV